MLKLINRCRICCNSHLTQVLDLGEQALTGVFPDASSEQVTSGPLQLLKCDVTAQAGACGLLQLAHSYDLNEMYGDNYGYRSGLNPSMVAHLQEKVRRILGVVKINPEDLVVDIGSNDCTTLRAYPPGAGRLVGIDPTGAKFRKYYPDHVELLADFFSLKNFRDHFDDLKAKVVTSFSMFYDLEAPLDFVQEVKSVLHPDGIWVFEQSYMPTMLERNSYDTVCHEHLEYYGLSQIKWMTDKVGFRIVDVEFNDVNGGSFSVTAAHEGSVYPTFPGLERLLQRERQDLKLDTLSPYFAFAKRVAGLKNDLLEFLGKAKNEGKKVAALGASTKGNVILQYCGITTDLIDCVGEVNPDKFGKVTPGTHIPIIPEDQAIAVAPDYLLVLPWHFRAFFLAQPKYAGKTLMFPLPDIEFVMSSRN